MSNKVLIADKMSLKAKEILKNNSEIINHYDNIFIDCVRLVIIIVLERVKFV